MSALDPLGWKIALATRGVRLAPDAAALAPDSSAATIDVQLPAAVRVAAPLGADSPFELAHEGNDRVVLRDTTNDGARIEVQVAPPPRFRTRSTSRGVPMQRIAHVHGSHLVVHPAAACGWGIAGAPCRFCVEGARGARDDDAVAVSDVIDTVRAAFEEGAAEHVLFNGSPFDVDDGGMAWLTPFVEGVRKHFDTLVAVQVHPPRDLRWADRAYAMGVDALSYGLELFDADVMARHCIGRARYIGRERYLEALAHAASIFPRGTVWSELVAGIEPLDATQAGIDALNQRGVVPVVVVPGRRTHEVDVAALTPVLEHLYRVTRDRGIALGWVRDLCIGVTPLEARFAAGDDARMAVAVQEWTRSRIGGLAARTLARFRRRLRVRSIGDSFDSAHL